MKKALLFFLLISFSGIAQVKLNSYKYAIIPSRFDFQKKSDEYGLNTLLKYKFQQLGFETYLETDELPNFLLENSCIAIKPFIEDDSGVFLTTLKVVVKNCYGEILFVTQEGKSRTKTYRLAYNEALRSALKSFNSYSLQYAPEKHIEKDSLVNKGIVVENAKTELTALNSESNVSNKVIDKAVSIDTHFIIKPSGNGFILLNNATQKIDFTIYLTNNPDTFIIKGQTGVIYKKNSKWYREFVNNGTLEIEELDIRF